jgi:hypothetical protein
MTKYFDTPSFESKIKRDDIRKEIYEVAANPRFERALF